MKKLFIIIALLITGSAYAEKLVLSPLPKITCKKHPEVCEASVVTSDSKRSSTKCLNGILFYKINKLDGSSYWKEATNTKGKSIKCRTEHRQ